ncbi:hypothetical protein C0J50_9137, partial [Silurus asotus]
SECGVDSVEEPHRIRDAVEGQSSCTVIHIHSYSGGRWTLKLSSNIIMIEVDRGRRTHQTPGLIVQSKPTLITFSFPADLFI